MKTADDIKDDLQRYNFDDPEIEKAYENLRRLFAAKGLPYRELLDSKTFGTAKYLLKEFYDEDGTMLVTDLDTNATYQFFDRKKKTAVVKTNDRIRSWVNLK